MSIYFCRSDTFMAQHLLYCPKIGSSIKQMGSDCMPQRVRTDFLTNATSFTSPLDNIEDHYSGELCPPAIQKQNILVAPLYIEG